MTRATFGLDDRTYEYLLAHEPPEHPLLQELREVTSTMAKARMQIAPEQGALLSFLVKLTGARRILEVGTFTGYSSLVMAMALPANGKLVALDVSEEWTSIARKYWERGGVAKKMELRLGPAVATLKQLENDGLGASFDLAFVDANKEDYDAYYEGALRLVRPAGLVIVDNTLRAGEVADLNNKEAGISAVRALNAKIARDERVDRVLLPLADGVTLVRKR